MALGYIFHHESVLGKQFFRSLRDFLSVLQRTSRMIGDDEIAKLLLKLLMRRLQFDAADIFRNVLGEPRNLRGRAGKIAVLAQHEAVILDHRAATRRRHQDGIEPAAAGLAEPGLDVGAGARQYHGLDRGGR